VRGRNPRHTTYSTREVDLDTENTDVLGTGELDVGNGVERDGHVCFLYGELGGITGVCQEMELEFIYRI
jgi:hypothetical protein